MFGLLTHPAPAAMPPARPESAKMASSPNDAPSRMLKKSASGVLASLRGSTYRSVRLASSLAAALLDGLFEHPETLVTSVP